MWRRRLARLAVLRDKIAEVLAEARDNVDFGTTDEWAGLATPDGVDVVPQELWSDRLAEYTTDQKITLTKELERLTLSLDGRVRIDDEPFDPAHTGGGEQPVFASPQPPASPVSMRATGCASRCSRPATRSSPSASTR